MLLAWRNCASQKIKMLLTMKLSELKLALAKNPEANVRFRLPNNELVPAHAHVTEAARVDKKFVDCGGTFRNEAYCRLQTWVAADLDHRLNAGKLLKILSKAEILFEGEDLEVDIEHELEFISQFPVESAETGDGEIILKLGVRHTACLAMDQCCPPAPNATEFRKIDFNFKPSSEAAACCSR
jgi:hypothetical protein